MTLKTTKGIASVKDNQAVMLKGYLNALRKTAPRTPVINTLFMVESNDILENPCLEKRVSNTMER